MKKVSGYGPIPARIMIVGEAPGADEETYGKPFVGKSGWLLDEILAAAGIHRAACFITNVVKYRPPANELESNSHAWITDKKTKAKKYNCEHFADGQWFNDFVREGLEELTEEIHRVRPDCIIALGNAPLWALTGETGISNWRGSELWWKGARLNEESIPVIPTYHPAYVLRVYEWKATVIHDLRTRVVAKLDHPELRELPLYRFIVPDSLNDVTMVTRALSGLLMAATAAKMDVTCDVETRHGRIACVGFGWSTLDAICIPIMHVDGSRWWSVENESVIVGCIKSFMEHSNVRIINQNFNYDRQYFICDSVFGFRPRLHYDTMIGQHLLFPGAEKSLAYQSSMYCRWHRYWKGEGKEIESEDEPQWWLYNCKDCVTTWEISQVTRRMLIKAGLATEQLL